MSNFQLQDITLFNDSFDLSLKGSWINFQTQMQKTVIHRVLSFHVETVAVLSRKSATKAFIPVTVSPKDMGLDEAKAQPTYENIRKYVKETHGLTVSTLNIAQMKAECGLEMECDRSGGKQQPKCPPEKREAILDAFRHFGMIEDGTLEE